MLRHNLHATPTRGLFVELSCVICLPVFSSPLLYHADAYPSRDADDGAAVDVVVLVVVLVLALLRLQLHELSVVGSNGLGRPGLRVSVFRNEGVVDVHARADEVLDASGLLRLLGAEVRVILELGAVTRLVSVQLNPKP
jgi:hypothetical protein